MSLRRIIPFAIAVLLLPPPPVDCSGRGGPGDRAVTAPPRSLTDVVADDVAIAFADALGFFGAPLSFGPGDRERAAVSLGAVGIFLAMDESLNRGLAGTAQPAYLDRPLEWGEEWGRLRTMQYSSIALYVGGLISGSDPIRVTGRLLGEALFLGGLPAITMQYGLGRSRPLSGKGAWDYQYFEWANEFQSLPSGHATVAFAASTVLAKRIDRVWASIPLYAAAGLTALSLGWSNQHWPSDLVVGAALGYLAGSFVVSREEERSRSVGGTGGDGGAGGDHDPQGPGRKRPDRFRAGIGPGGVTLSYILN